jgi:MFS transporter, PAT family, beta-lactamase induction signal transducer AmpG
VDGAATAKKPAGRMRPAVVLALASLYTAQGVPFGFATEYLPVVLREQGVSYAGIAALSWLQLPWQLKVFWAKAADHPNLRARTRLVILAMQLGLTATVAGFALRSLKEAPLYWFILTFLAAALAATQDVFVDAFAVRVLRPEERGFGNTAQVAGYRVGMLLGGAALLLLVDSLGEKTTLLACAGVVGAASLGAFFGSESPADQPVTEEKDTKAAPARLRVVELLRHMLRQDAWPVFAIALTYKLGLHMASALLKPMAVDYGWSKKSIGAAVVVVGSIGALLGAAAGGVLHRALKERRALHVALLFQALVCVPLIFVDRLHAPFELTRAAIFIEHFGSGLGTTVLFAALMTATRPADAGLQYTILTSANAVAIGVGGLTGALIADHVNRTTAFIAATAVCLLPGIFLPRWDRAASASRA